MNEPELGVGPGKYDDAATAAREKTGGSVLLIVIGGAHGHGFAVQATPDVVIGVPQILRQVADNIEKLQATHKNS